MLGCWLLAVSLQPVVEPSAPVVPDAAAVSPAPVQDPFGVTSVRPATPALDPAWVKVRAPQAKGTVLFALSAASFGVAAVTQLIDASVFRGTSSGVAERLAVWTGMILAPIGADVRGRYDAYRDRVLGLDPRRTRGTMIAGVVLTVLGTAASVTNEVFWWKCSVGEAGPYHTGGTAEPVDEFSARLYRPCRYDIGGAALDLGGATLAVGAGLLTWSLRYRHDSAIFRRARIAVTPSLGPRYAGFGLGARF